LALAIARDKKTVGELAHAEGVRYRSIFVPYVRVSGRRQDAIRDSAKLPSERSWHDLNYIC
jgi:hypothetical protein